MKNYVQDGKAITVAAPAAVASGEAVAIGSLFGVAIHAAESGDDVTIQTEGVVSLPCAAGVSAGDPLEWDGTGDELVALDTGVQVGIAVADVAGGLVDVKIG